MLLAWRTPAHTSLYNLPSLAETVSVQYSLIDFIECVQLNCFGSLVYMFVMKMLWKATPDSSPLIHFTLKGNWQLQQKDLEQFLISFALVSISCLAPFQIQESFIQICQFHLFFTKLCLSLSIHLSKKNCSVIE